MGLNPVALLEGAAGFFLPIDRVNRFDYLSGMDIDKRISDLKAKLKARKGGGRAYAKNCEEIEREIIRLENLKLTTSKSEPDDSAVAS